MGEIRKTGETVGPAGGVYGFPNSQRRVATEEPASHADSVSVGEAAREASAALHVVEASPGVRIERVTELRAKIARGDYQPDAREIAREILNRGL
ncbi:MAG: flagellar biosynthesis anti-sigma factor FlgM [Dehalococcoidia bacterium]|nr:flagellar biosynthesis anti-sigma factor FlgM [Dehalococcoidia bacterium]